MNPLKWLWSKIVPVANKIGAFIAQAWKKAEPFLQEVASETVQIIWSESKDLLIAGVGYVAAQGLPTGEEKQTAFKKFLKERSNIAVDNLRDRELDLLRQMALAIYDAAQTKK